MVSQQVFLVMHGKTREKKYYSLILSTFYIEAVQVLTHAHSFLPTPIQLNTNIDTKYISHIAVHLHV